jgi:hypothetical protein
MVQWAPLARRLEDDGRDRIELTYRDLEAILGGPLPASATTHRPQFWSNAVGGGVSRSWLDVGFRTVLRGMPRDAVAFVRGGTAARREPAGLVEPGPAQPSADVLLIGCVKSKADEARPARDLYTSDLFARRRAFAEASGLPWAVLSSEHGAVDPDEVIAPYDRFLEEQPIAYQRAWGQRVVEQLEAAYGPLAGRAFELHASRAYGDPIEPLLRARGATLLRPLDGLRSGEQLRWYGGEVPRVAPPPAAAPAQMAAPADVVDRGAGVGGLAARITRAFALGELDLSGRPVAPVAGWERMPEIGATERVRAMGASGVEVRAFLTLVSALDRTRDADRLWERGADAFASARGLFDPHVVTEHSLTELDDELRATGLSRRHMVDAAAWRIICESLDDAAVAPAVRDALLDGRGDARELLIAVQARTPEGSDRFPLLRGPRIRARWVRSLAHPGGAEIDNLDVLPVTVDAPVRRVTENLGVTATAGRPLDDVRDAIQDAWAQDVAAHGADGPTPIAGTAAALDPALWFYGRWGCTFCERARRALPIHDVCKGCRLLA